MKKFNQLIDESEKINVNEHIHVINFNDYLKFINLIPNIQYWRFLSDLDKKVLYKFQWAIELGMKSNESNSSLEILIEAGIYYRNLSD